MPHGPVRALLVQLEEPLDPHEYRQWIEIEKPSGKRSRSVAKENEFPRREPEELISTEKLERLSREALGSLSDERTVSHVRPDSIPPLATVVKNSSVSGAPSHLADLSIRSRCWRLVVKSQAISLEQDLASATRNATTPISSSLLNRRL